MSQEHKLSLEIPVCKLKKKKMYIYILKHSSFSSLFSETEHLKGWSWTDISAWERECEVGGKWTSFFLAKARKQEKKINHNARKKAKQSCLVLSVFVLKMMTCQKNIFLHVFPFPTVPETNTCASLPNCCYSQTWWVPLPLILCIDRPDRGGTEGDCYPGVKGVTK